MKDLNQALTIGAFALALGSNFVWLLLSYGNLQKKRYGAERDFDHLKNSQKQIVNSVHDGFENIEDRLDSLSHELLEIKAYLINKCIYKDDSH
ncbi:MAG: hypothetical protein WBF90_37845 [Rivularia sp. (in: cyanobacteria)]